MLLVLSLDAFCVCSLQAKCTYPSSLIEEQDVSVYRSVTLLNPLAWRGNPSYKDSPLVAGRKNMTAVMNVFD
jgi:hypothetical protein